MARNKWLTCCVLAALVLRIAFVLYHAHVGWQLRADAGYYRTLAENLRHGVYTLFHPHDIPDTTRMPGLPFLLFLLSGSIPLLLAVHVLASTAKVMLVHRLALVSGLEPRTALLAAGLMAFEPVDIMVSASLLTEACFTTALLGGTLLLAGYQHRWPGLLGAAACLALACWFRANGLLLAAWLATTLVIVRRLPLRRAMACLAVVLALLSPWVLRNRMATGRLVLSDSGAVAAAYFHVPQVLAAAGDPRARTHLRGLWRKGANTRWEDRLEAAAFFDELRGDVRRTFLEHPVAWCAVQVRDAAGTYIAPGRGHIRSFLGRSRSGLAVKALSMTYTVLLCAAIPVWVMRRRQMPWGAAIALMLAAGIVLSSGISTMDARFKNPAMPLLLIGAAWAVHQLWRPAVAGPERRS